MKELCAAELTSVVGRTTTVAVAFVTRDVAETVTVGVGVTMAVTVAFVTVAVVERVSTTGRMVARSSNSVVVIVVMPETTMDVSMIVSVDVGDGKAGSVRVVVRPSVSVTIVSWAKAVAAKVAKRMEVI